MVCPYCLASAVDVDESATMYYCVCLECGREWEEQILTPETYQEEEENDAEYYQDEATAQHEELRAWDEDMH